MKTTKAIIKYAEILPALKKAMPGIDSGGVLDGADSLIFKNDRIYSYNDSVSVSTPFRIDDDIKFVVRAREFYNIVSKFKHDEIAFELGEENVSLKCGRAKASFTLLEDTLGMSISSLSNEQNDWESLPENYKENLIKCSIKGSNNYSIAGIFANGDSMFSTDGVRINYFTLKSPIKRFWLSDYAANIVLKVGDFNEYCLSKNWVHFRDKDGTILSCRRLPDEKYPERALSDIVNSHKRDDNDLYNELPDDFIDAVNRAASLSIDIDNYNAVKLTFSKEGINVSSRRVSGSYDEMIPWVKPFEKDFEPISIYVDNSMVENGLFYSKNFYLKTVQKGGKGITRIVFASENGMHILGTLENE